MTNHPGWCGDPKMHARHGECLGIDPPEPPMLYANPTADEATAAGPTIEQMLDQWVREGYITPPHGGWTVPRFVAAIRAAALDEARAAVGSIHHAQKHTDYVAIPPFTEDVCPACKVGDGFQSWPCDTWVAIDALREKG